MPVSITVVSPNWLAARAVHAHEEDRVDFAAQQRDQFEIVRARTARRRPGKRVVHVPGGLVAVGAVDLLVDEFDVAHRQPLEAERVLAAADRLPTREIDLDILPPRQAETTALEVPAVADARSGTRQDELRLVGPGEADHARVAAQRLGADRRDIAAVARRIPHGMAEVRFARLEVVRFEDRSELDPVRPESVFEQPFWMAIPRPVGTGQRVYQSVSSFSAMVVVIVRRRVRGRQWTRGRAHGSDWPGAAGRDARAASRPHSRCGRARALELGLDEIDGLVERGRQHRGDKVEAVGGAVHEPVLDLVGDVDGRADRDAMTRHRVEAQEELVDR